MRSLGWAFSNMTGVLIRSSHLDTDPEDRHGGKMALYESRRKASEEINPAHTLISNF